MKLFNIGLGVVLAGGLLVTSQARAVFMIDDFNIDSPLNTATDNDNNYAQGIQETDENGNGSTYMNQLNGGGDWDRNYFVFLTSGDPAGVNIEACSSCQTGHFSEDAGADGYGGFFWNNSTYDPDGTPPVTTPTHLVNLSSYNRILFEYATDVVGADVIMVFYDENFSIISTMHWGDLPDTNNILETASGSLPSGDYSQVSWISMNLYGISGTVQFGNDIFIDLGRSADFLDMSIDDVRAVPEPSGLVLMGLGLAGLGWRHRRHR